MIATATNTSAAVAIDLRMFHSSGIGTYIQNIVPRVLAHPVFAEAVLIGRSSDITALENTEKARIVDFNAPIHALSEQLGFPDIHARLLWSPNYNIPLKHRGKLVVTVHDVYHLACSYRIQELHKKLYASFMFQQLAKRASAIICDSQFTADELMRLAGIDSRRICVIHLGVDESWFRIPKHAGPEQPPYLLAVGNVKPNKNLSRLFEAFAAICDRLPHDLMIVGKKEGFVTGDDAALRKAARLGNRVIFTGRMGDEDLRQCFAHADALVFPSFYEGFGLPPLEAMAAGCPVVASRAASIPEVCGDAAEYFDPLDVADMSKHILRVLSNSDLRQELIAKGDKRARLFRWSDCATSTIQVLLESMER